MTKMKALKNFSYGGMKKKGDLFEVEMKRDVAYFERLKLAETAEQDPAEFEQELELEPSNDKQDSAEDEFKYADDSFDDEEEESFDDDDITAADTHAKLDEIQNKLGLEDLPGREKLTLAQRKAKIRSELSANA